MSQPWNVLIMYQGVLILKSVYVPRDTVVPNYVTSCKCQQDHCLHDSYYYNIIAVNNSL